MKLECFNCRTLARHNKDKNYITFVIVFILAILYKLIFSEDNLIGIYREILFGLFLFPGLGFLIYLWIWKINSCKDCKTLNNIEEIFKKS